MLQEEGKFFICRIKENTTKTILKENGVPDDSIVFFESAAFLGSQTSVQTQREVRLITHTVEDTDYWIATNRLDLIADQIAEAYKLRWELKFFSPGGNAIYLFITYWRVVNMASRFSFSRA